MTPRQARNISAWQNLHPFFYVVPYEKHVISPGDPWKYLIRQKDNDHLIGTVNRTMHVSTRDFNQGLIDQLWRSLTTGQPPKEGGHRPLATPLVSPDGGTLTPHPSIHDEPNEDTLSDPDNPHHSDKTMTGKQADVLATWERLHPDLSVTRDPDFKPIRYSPWRFKVVHRSNSAVIGWFEKHKTEAKTPADSQMINQLRNMFSLHKIPKQPSPKKEHLQNPLTGRLMTRPSPSPGQGSTAPHFPGWGTPEWSDAAHNLASGGDYPPPIPELGKPIVLTGYGLHLWKYGERVPYPGPDAPPISTNTPPKRTRKQTPTKIKPKAKTKAKS
jgi:hypothetical protein